jgi:VIT1/CCC1 family predicted Fe2+/Mn2+ transporter
MGLSIVITAVTSFLIGFVVSRLAGNSAWRGGMRHAAVVFAAIVTFGVGKLFGTSVA